MLGLEHSVYHSRENGNSVRKDWIQGQARNDNQQKETYDALRYLQSAISYSFIKTASENPVLWTGMKGASAESRKNKSDAEISSA